MEHYVQKHNIGKDPKSLYYNSTEYVLERQDWKLHSRLLKYWSIKDMKSYL